MRSSDDRRVRFGRLSGVLPILGLTATLASGCKKPAAPEATAEQVLTEEGDDGTITWDVEPDGSVHAALAGADGTPITKNIAGRLTWPGDVADQEREMKVDNGALIASGPPLQDDLTEIDYSLEVDGKTWSGALHMPRGGTRSLDDDAKTAAATVIPVGKLGPNGGNIQMIGGEPVELVADAQTQEIRFYALDRNYNVIDPGDRTVRLGYAADYSGVEVLVREPGALYYVGPWYAGYNPSRVTIAVGFGGVVHVGVMGWRYGERVRFGAGAPPVVGFVGTTRGWSPSVGVRAGVSYGAGFNAGVGVGGRARVGGAVAVVGGGGGQPGRGGAPGGGQPSGVPAAGAPAAHPVDGPNGQGREPQGQAQGRPQASPTPEGTARGQGAPPTGGRAAGAPPTPAPHEEPRGSAAGGRSAPQPAARPAPRPAPARGPSRPTVRRR
jgi:hypothetical protein